MLQIRLTKLEAQCLEHRSGVCDAIADVWADTIDCDGADTIAGSVDDAIVACEMFESLLKPLCLNGGVLEFADTPVNKAVLAELLVGSVWLGVIETDMECRAKTQAELDAIPRRMGQQRAMMQRLADKLESVLGIPVNAP